MPDNEEVETWSNKVATLAVDMLVDYGFVKTEEFEKASEVVAEEILVRLLLNDYPPPLSEKIIKKP